MMRLTALATLAVTALAACGSPAATGSTDTSTPFAQPKARQPVLQPCPQPGSQSALQPLRLPCLGTSARTVGSVDPSRLGGHPTLVNLWASWCIPCQKEMPVLQKAFVANDSQIRFLGVDVKDSRDSALDFLAYVGVTYPQAEDRDGQLLAALHGVGLPMTVVLRADGSVAWRKIGQLHGRDLQQALAAVR